nr:zinc finger protein 431 [Quercus suber]
MSAGYQTLFDLLPESNLRQSSVYDQMQSPYDQPFAGGLSSASPVFALPIGEQNAQAVNQPDSTQPPTPGRLAGEPAFCSGRHCCKWSVAGCACNNHYPSAEDLDKHVAADHAGRHANGQPSGDYHCYWAGCSKGESFGNKPKLTRHIHSHTGHKPHQCLHPGCGKGFVTKEQLKNHETTHTKTRGHICPECGKGFAVKTALTSHMNVHKGAKPYICEECGKGFADSSNLSKHKAIHKRVQARKHRHAAHRLSMSSTGTSIYTPPPPPGLEHHLHTYHHPADMLMESVEANDQLALCSRPCYDVQCPDDDRIPCRSLSPCKTVPCSSADCEPTSYEPCSIPPCDLPDCDFQDCDLPVCPEDCMHFCDPEHYDPGLCASEDEACGRTPSPPLLQRSVTSQPSQPVMGGQPCVSSHSEHHGLQPFSSISPSTSLRGLEGMEFATTEGFKQLHDFIHSDYETSQHGGVGFG